MLFRIDDISMNTDLDRLNAIMSTVALWKNDAKFMLAFSPLVFDLSKEPDKDRERAFPRRLSAMSDHRNFFKVNKLGLPRLLLNKHTTIASHGLVHVDHRLMGREAQELSIVTSCSLLGAEVFVPPFNKWDKDTESICEEHKIELVKFEHGWRHVGYNKFNKEHELYYCHTHDVTPHDLAQWLRA